MRFTPPVHCLIAAVFLLVGSCAPTPDTAPELPKPAGQPNIVVYLSDDQNVYDYGSYGNEKVRTPAVDRLAAEGLRFTNAFTGQAICAPSRSQLYTGLYPLRNGCFANHTSVKPEVESVTTHLRRLGYEVVLAGKSHVKPARVFDWDHYWPSVPRAGAPRDFVPLDSIEHYFRTAQGPFCLFVASTLPHPEYYPVDRARAEDIKFYPFNEERKSDTAYVRTMARYYRSIAEDNRQLADVLDLVDRHLDDNTLFVYSADHGATQKFTVRDAGLRVPFVVRWPGVIAPGSTAEQMIHYTDVLPTLMELAGGTAPAELDGKSFLPLLLGRDTVLHDYVYGVRTNQNILRSEVFPSRMIRGERFKYVRNFNALEVLDRNLGDRPNVNVFLRRGALAFPDEPFEELYDLAGDPFERENLASDPNYREVKARLIRDLFAWMEQQGDFLDDRFGNLPLITPRKNRQFNLDRDTRVRQIPDSLKGTLTEADLLVIDYW